MNKEKTDEKIKSKTFLEFILVNLAYLCGYVSLLASF